MHQKILDLLSKITLIVNTLCFLMGIFAVLHQLTFILIGCLLLLSINMLLYWGISTRQNQLQKTEKQNRSFQADTPCAGNSGNIPSEAAESQSAQFCILPEASSQPPSIVFPLIRHFLEEYETAIMQAQLQVSIRCDDESLSVSIPSDIFYLILANIMDNTLKYLPSKGMLTITLSQIENHMLLIWKDNGPGLETADTGRLCSLNYQGPNKLCGNGLGLAQVYAAIYSYNGTLDIRSSKDNGFALYIQLPLSMQA